MKARVLVLGGTGFIGRRVVAALHRSDWAQPVSASRSGSMPSAGVPALRLDSLNRSSLEAALRGVDAVVNCVLGDRRSIDEGAQVLVASAAAAGCRRLVHLSTMSVYGSVEGTVTEDSLLHPDLGWYGSAKCAAEEHIAGFARRGEGDVVVLRPGCVYGDGGEQWVGRFCRWLKSGRLGDLGAAGDGWSNLVHVDDVVQAVLHGLRLPVPDRMPAVFNLSAPDSPRWNDYFVRLAVEIGATPVRRITPVQLALEVKLLGLPLKVLEKVFAKAGIRGASLPDGIPPSLARLWAQEIRLDSTPAARVLGVRWTDFDSGVRSAARAWRMQQQGQRSAEGAGEARH